MQITEWSHQPGLVNRRHPHGQEEDSLATRLKDDMYMTSWFRLGGFAISCALACLGSAVASAATAPVPGLAETELYTTTVHGCRTVDLTSWRHPTREVLQASRAQVREVQLCNDDQFPVFTVSLPYDIDGPNDRQLNRLYADLAAANGFWSLALVDLAADVVITLEVDRQSYSVSPTYENFRR